MHSEQPAMPLLVDTLKYITFMNFSDIDAQYILPGASISTINHCEQLLGHAIPGEVWEYWSECGGEAGMLGIAMGARALTIQQSIDSVLEFSAHFTDEDEQSLIPLFIDDAIHAIIAVRSESGEVVVMPEPDALSHISNIVIAESLKTFLDRLVIALVQNQNMYEASNGRYKLHIGDGSYIRHILLLQRQETEITDLFASQSLSL